MAKYTKARAAVVDGNCLRQSFIAISHHSGVTTLRRVRRRPCVLVSGDLHHGLVSSHSTIVVDEGDFIRRCQDVTNAFLVSLLPPICYESGGNDSSMQVVCTATIEGAAKACCGPQDVQLGLLATHRYCLGENPTSGRASHYELLDASFAVVFPLRPPRIADIFSNCVA